MREIVMDTETTGLDPAHGHRIVEIGAVELLNHMPTGRTFHKYINPKRDMPAEAFAVHGLSAEFLADKPLFADVVDEFVDFIGDARLVIHNASFDMKFLTLKEAAAGVRFDGPVLDTMLVSSLLDGPDEDHSLDALCERYGVAVTARHSALADTIGTARILLHFIDRLEAKGLTTFGEVMKATNMAAELRHRGAVVGHGTGTGG